MDCILFYKSLPPFQHFISSLNPWTNTLIISWHPFFITKQKFNYITTRAASRSAMANNGEETRKRKVNFFVGESSNQAPSNNRIDYSAFRGQPLVIPPGVPHVPLSFESSETPALNMAMVTRPFSHSHLLSGPDPEGYFRSYLTENRCKSQPMDTIINLHGEMLKNELSRLVETLADKKAKKTLEKKELQLRKRTNMKQSLEMTAEMFRKQAEELVLDIKCSEQTASSLRNKLKKANKRMQEAHARQNNEPFNEDLITLGPSWVNCRACTIRVATVMMLPCRHICVCPQCQDVTMTCPECGQTKGDCIEVYIPYK